MGIKGFKSQQALQRKLNGYTEDQSVDQARYTTIQEMSGRRHALDVLIHGAYQIGTVKSIVTGSNVRIIKSTAHGANKNDIIRLSNGTEFSAISVPDVNTIVTSVELDIDPTGDTFTVWRHITPSYNNDGSLNVSVSQGPVQYNRKTGGVTTATQVLEDLDTPTNSRALPVVIQQLDGAPINITAGDLNVSLRHNGADPSSIKIGDGTTLVGVTVSNAMKVDASATTQPISAASLPLPALASTSTLQTTGNTSLGNLDTKTPALGQALAAASRPVVLTAIQQAALTPPAAITGFNLETTQTAMSAKLPATLGQKAMAASMAVTLASDQGPISVTTNGTDITTTGALTILNSTVAIVTAGMSNVAFQVLGTWVGTITSESSIDGGTTWNAETMMFSSGLTGLTISVNNYGAILCAGHSNIRLRMSSYTSGTANITLRATVATGAVQIATALPQGSNLIGKVSIDQSTPGTTNLVSLTAETTKVIGTVNNVASTGRAKVTQLFNDYTVTPVTTAAYVQLTASTASVTNRLEVFDSSGEVLILAVGAAASEVDQLYVFPGGNGIIDLAIPASSRISIKAKTNTASVGLIAINLYS